MASIQASRTRATIGRASRGERWALVPRVLERDAEMERVLSMPNWKGVKLEHARHYLWLTHHDEVLREMTTFLGTSS